MEKKFNLNQKLKSVQFKEKEKCRKQIVEEKREENGMKKIEDSEKIGTPKF